MPASAGEPELARGGFISQLSLTVHQCHAGIAFDEGDTDVISCLLSSLCLPQAR